MIMQNLLGFIHHVDVNSKIYPEMLAQFKVDPKAKEISTPPARYLKNETKLKYGTQLVHRAEMNYYI
eukprot:snap_masked-scaffold_32-processed-gene-3.0-mRNA-1 protein AED:1.00 eAED:1.00 QI:0/0/0/0/1/1/2/0/66